MCSRVWGIGPSAANNQDCAVHLSCTGDHVLDIISMAWAVNVCIVTFVCLIFNMGGGDGYTALILFRCIVDLVKGLEFGSDPSLPTPL